VKEEITVHSLWVLCAVRLVSLVPRYEQPIAHGQSGGMVRCEVIEIVHAPCEGGVDMSDDFPFKVLFCVELVEGKIFPQAAGDGGDTRRYHLDFLLAIACWSAGMSSWTRRKP
jgi:hypothetical protein